MSTPELAQAKQAVKRMRARLSALGHTIPNTHVYEALAACLDYSDWNRCEAALSRTQPAVVFDPPRRYLLAMPPGTGKSTMLMHLFKDAITRGEMPLWIDFSPFPKAQVPPEDAAIMRTWIDTTGVARGLASFPHGAKAIHIHIDLDASAPAYGGQRYSVGAQDTLTACVVAVLTTINKLWPQHADEAATKRFGWLLVDEFAHACVNTSLLTTLDETLATTARVVLADMRVQFPRHLLDARFGIITIKGPYASRFEALRPELSEDGVLDRRVILLDDEQTYPPFGVIDQRVFNVALEVCRALAAAAQARAAR